MCPVGPFRAELARELQSLAAELRFLWLCACFLMGRLVFDRASSSTFILMFESAFYFWNEEQEDAWRRLRRMLELCCMVFDARCWRPRYLRLPASPVTLARTRKCFTFFVSFFPTDSQAKERLLAVYNRGETKIVRASIRNFNISEIYMDITYSKSNIVRIDKTAQ